MLVLILPLTLGLWPWGNLLMHSNPSSLSYRRGATTDCEVVGKVTEAALKYIAQCLMPSKSSIQFNIHIFRSHDSAGIGFRWSTLISEVCGLKTEPWVIQPKKQSKTKNKKTWEDLSENGPPLQIIVIVTIAVPHLVYISSQVYREGPLCDQTQRDEWDNLQDGETDRF